MIVSFQLMRRQPRVMGLWAAIIVLAIAAGFITWFAGLVVTVPLIVYPSIVIVAAQAPSPVRVAFCIV